MTSHIDAHSSRSLLARLGREWEVIVRRPAVLARAARWELGIPFRSLDDVVAATGYWVGRDARLAAARGATVAAADAPSADAVLARLIVAARIDDLAARVILQRMLPGIIARARTWARRDHNPEALDDMLAASWAVARTFPVERRPSHLAANLLRDAEYQAFIRPTRRLAVHEPTAPHLLDRYATGASPVAACDELAELVEAATRARSLSDRDLRLVRLLVLGRSMADVADELEVSVRTVSNHRDALVRRLQQTARDLAAA